MNSRLTALAAFGFAAALNATPAFAQTTVPAPVFMNADEQVEVDPRIVNKNYGDHPQVPVFSARPLRPEEVIPETPYTPPRQFKPMGSGLPYVQSYMNRSIEVTPSGDFPGTTHYGFHAPGGYEPRIGSPYYYDGGLGPAAVTTQSAGGDPYGYHFGPGFYRSQELGHYRFPYYSYRRPWYHPGFANYNRDTNFHW